MESGSLSGAEFKTLFVRRLNECSENFNSIKKDTETIKKNHSEMKDTLTERNDLQKINSRVDETKDQIRDLEYKEAKSIQSEQQKEEKIQKN